MKLLKIVTLYITSSFLCYPMVLNNMEAQLTIGLGIKPANLSDIVFEQLKNDAPWIQNPILLIDLEKLSEELLAAYQNLIEHLSGQYKNDKSTRAFIERIIAIESLKKIRRLYAHLRAIQTDPPLGKQAQEVSTNAFSPEASNMWTVFSYKSLFEDALKSGLTKEYQNLLLSNTRSALRGFSSFIAPENLQWVAYMQNTYGPQGPFSYNPPNTATNNWDNPELGIYITDKDIPMTITRYSFLEGLLDTINKIQPDALLARSWAIRENLTLLIKNLQQAIEYAETKNKPSSQKFQKLYNELLVLQNTTLPQETTIKASQSAFDLDYDHFLTNAQRTGLVEAYKNLLLSKAIPRTMLNTFITPEHLQWIAYLRNKHGSSQYPFAYYPTNAGNEPWNNPVLGIYTSSQGNEIIITRYSFFQGLLEIINAITADEWVQNMSTIEDNLAMLANNLTEAISEAQKNYVYKPIPQQPKAGYDPTTPEGKIIAKLNKMQVNSLERNPEIEELLYQLKCINDDGERLAENEYIPRYITALAQGEPMETLKKSTPGNIKNVIEAKLGIKGSLVKFLIREPHAWEPNEVRVNIANDLIRKLFVLINGDETARFYCKLLQLFTKDYTIEEIYAIASNKK